MFKTGSKFLYGLAGLGLVSAILLAAATGDHPIGMDTLLGPLTFGYKGYVGDHVGYTVLISLSFISLFGGIFLSALRDSDAEAAAQVVGLETVPEVPAPATANYWPVIGGFSAGAVVIGLAVGPIMAVVGLVGLTITAFEWAARSWADRATGDPEVNQGIRDRLLQPIEIPALAVLVIGGIVLAVQQILLALPKIGSYLVFGLVPVAILVVGSIIVLKPKLSQSVIAGMLLVGGFAILAGGVAATIAGERDHGGHSKEKGGHSKGEEGLAPQTQNGIPVIVVAN